MGSVTCDRGSKVPSIDGDGGFNTLPIHSAFGLFECLPWLLFFFGIYLGQGSGLAIYFDPYTCVSGKVSGNVWYCFVVI